MIASKVDLTVLYIIAGALSALLVLILAVSGVSGAKRRKRMKQAIDTIELSPDVRNHRGVARRRRKTGEKPVKAQEEPEDEAIVPATELTEEEAVRMHEEAVKASAQAAAAQEEMRQQEPENRRRRQPVEVPTDETLRVAPVDQRPEFIAQGKVDDSETRIFGRMAVQTAIEEEAKAAAEAAQEPAAPVKEASVKEAPAEEPAAEETIRISREQIEEIRGKQAEREDTFSGKKGKKRDEIKPMKKKKKGFLFGRGKADDEDDFVEDGEWDESGEDDLFE